MRLIAISVVFLFLPAWASACRSGDDECKGKKPGDSCGTDKVCYGKFDYCYCLQEEPEACPSLVGDTCSEKEINSPCETSSGSKGYCYWTGKSCQCAAGCQVWFDPLPSTSMETQNQSLIRE